MSNSGKMPPHVSPKTTRRRGGGEWLLDLITVIFTIAAVVVIVATVLLISNPKAAFNPFPQAVLPTFFHTPSPTITLTPSTTPTATITPLPPTPTPSHTPEPSPSATITPSPTATALLEGVAMPTLATTLDSEGNFDSSSFLDPLAPFPFVARAVRYEANANDQGCQWASLAGNISGITGEPILDMAVEVSGTDFQFVRFSGSDSNFGASGFEVLLGSVPERDEYAVRLIGPIGIPVSDYVTIATDNTCNTNVVVVEFVQVRDY